MFVEDDDYLYMMGLLKEIADGHSLNIFAVCLMPNHMHFLMSPEQENLYDAMRDLFSRYAMRFNFKYGVFPASVLGSAGDSLLR